jgi:hypothetical protein
MKNHQKDWVPEDPKYRFDWEDPAYMPPIKKYEE